MCIYLLFHQFAFLSITFYPRRGFLAAREALWLLLQTKVGKEVQKPRGREGGRREKQEKEAEEGAVGERGSLSVRPASQHPRVKPGDRDARLFRAHNQNLLCALWVTQHRVTPRKEGNRESEPTAKDFTWKDTNSRG